MNKKGWLPTKLPGVRYREHAKRKHGVRFDRYFSIRFQVAGQRYEETLGWSSEGWTAEKAYKTLAELKENIRLGKGPSSLKEKREIAAREEAEKKAEAEKGKQANLTFGEFFRSTYFLKAQEDKSPATWQTERSYYKHWIEPVIGNRPMAQIGVIDLEKIKSRMTKAGLAPSTIADSLGLVRLVFNYARRCKRFTGENPVSLIKLPKRDNRRVRFLSREEADRLLGALSERSLQLHNISLLSLYCGLRAGEVFNLTWGDVDFQRRQLFIKDPKSGKNRYAYLTAETYSVLEELWTEQSSEEYVFLSSKGKKICWVSNLYALVVEELGFNTGITDRRKRVVFHTLRHTFASWLAESGVDLYTIAQLLGHSTIKMTERYAHLSEGSLRAAVDRLSSVTQNQALSYHPRPLASTAGKPGY